MEYTASLEELIQGCLKGKRESQNALYKDFYGYAMSICIRYAHGYDDAVEIVNDGFMKVFQHIKKYDSKRPFKAWLRTILINTAINHYRKNQKHAHHQDIGEALSAVTPAEAVSNIGYEEIIKTVQLLSPAYRTVFNLYVIDGYTHEEIADMLHISVGTSKSNLAKAKANLQKFLKKIYNYEFAELT